MPAIDEILEENAYSVSASVQMLQTLTSANSESQKEDFQEQFWIHFEKAKANITLKDESSLINDIEISAKTFWEPNSTAGIGDHLAQQLNQLAILNITAMEQKAQNAKLMGLAGAWALGFLLIISVGIQLLLREKILNALIYPVEGLLTVIKDYNSGNKMRRFAENKVVVEDVKIIGTLVNEILDKLSQKKNELNKER